MMLSLFMSEAKNWELSGSCCPKIKLTIAIFALILVGCSDDDNPVTSPTNNCSGYMTTYSENSANMSTGDWTAAECEAAYGAIGSYCSDGCEAADTPEDESVCGGETLTAEEITVLCAMMTGG